MAKKCQKEALIFIKTLKNGTKIQWNYWTYRYIVRYNSGLIIFVISMIL
jgi:hypothetical protein